MDNSWHLSLGALQILVDPWLEGPEVDFFRWFNTQWHRTPPLSYHQLPDFDGVLISQKYPDHLHVQTLQRLGPDRVITPWRWAARVQRALPEAEVSALVDGEPVIWKDVAMTLLASRRRLDPIYDAVLFDDGRQSVLFAPHGLPLDADHRAVIRSASPCALLLSPFNRYRLPAVLGGVVTPGMSGLAALVEAVAPARVVRTHDERKIARGLVPKLARIDVVDDAELARFPWLADRVLQLDDYEPVTL